MAKVYLIGGAPRAGKTTVIQKLIDKKPMLAASTDAIRNVEKNMIKPEDNPRLFKTARGAFDSAKNIKAFVYDPETILGYELGESEETWKSVLDFISYNIRDGKDVAIEGVAVLPKNIASLPFESRVVFVTCLKDQTKAILQHAHENKTDWLAKYSDEVIKAFCSFNQKLNQYYYDEATKLGLPCLTASSESFENDMDKAVKILLAN